MHAPFRIKISFLPAAAKTGPVRVAGNQNGGSALARKTIVSFSARSFFTSWGVLRLWDLKSRLIRCRHTYLTRNLASGHNVSFRGRLMSMNQEQLFISKCSLESGLPVAVSVKRTFSQRDDSQ